MSDETYIWYPIEKIGFFENVRQENIRADKTYKEFMENIRQQGLLSPIKIAPLKQDRQQPKTKYEMYIIYGHRRLTACSDLGWKEIKALVGPPMTRKDMQVENIIENIQRKDITELEYGRIFNDLNADFSVDEMAVKFSKPKSSVTRAMTLWNKLPERFRQDVIHRGLDEAKPKGKIPVTTAIEILNLQKRFNLNQNQTDMLLDTVKKDMIVKRKLPKIAMMLSAGYSVETILSEVDNYRAVAINLLAKKEDVARKEKKYGCSIAHVVKKILNGHIVDTIEVN